MKGHDEKLGVPQSIEIDVNIEELENRGWPRPRSVNAYKIEKESVHQDFGQCGSARTGSIPATT